ncbi:MAG: PAS domain S-box protein [Rubrivivax sp.]
MQSTAAFDAGYSTLPATIVLLGGILASGLLAGLLQQQRNGQRRAEDLAEGMTAEMARLAVVAERTSNAVIITDRQLRITWVNDAFTRLYGLTLDQALGRTPESLLGTPHSSAEAIATLARAAEAGVGCRVEVVNRTHDGQLVWLDTEVQPMLDHDGEVSGFVEIASDITTRRNADKRIAALARENAALLDTIHAHMIVSVTDRNGVIVEVNDAFCRISGHAREDLIGRTHAVVNSGVQSPSFWAAMWQTIASGKPWRGQVCDRARDGSLYWVDSIVAPVMGADGTIEKYVSLRTDISASRLAAHELAQQRQRLADIIEGTEAGTWECDLVSDQTRDLQQGRVRISSTYAALTGRTVTEAAAAMQPSFLALLHRGDVGPVEHALQEHLLGATPLYAVEYRMRHAAGHWVWIQSRGKVSERDAAGRPLRISGTVLDISVRKHAERELSRQRRALANIVEGTNAASWEWDVASGSLHFNAHWMQLIGCSEAKLADSRIEDWAAITHPDDLGGVQLLLARHFRGELPHFECEYRVRHADGRWIWLLTRGKAVSRGTDGRARWVAGTHIDISDRKAAAAELAASQAFLDQTGRIAGVGGWQVELQTQAITWSDQTCRIHDHEPGHQPTMEEAVGYYPAEARGPLQSALAHTIETGAGFDLELPLITASGRAIWVRSVGAVEHVDGRAARLVGAFQDITERRQLEDEVRRSNTLMKTVLANLPCALSVFDSELTLTMSNEMFGQLLDLPDALNQPGKTSYESIIRFNAARGEYGAGDPEVIVAAALQRLRGGVVPHQFERTRADGSVLEVSGAPMPDGGFVTTYTDVSARHRAEAEVERSERLLRGAIDAIDEAFVLFDPEDRFVFCNDKYRRIYHRSGELIKPGTPFEDIVRRGAERGEIPEAIGRVDEWVAERVLAHQAGETTPLQKLASGRTMRVVERRMPDGHIVGFRVDVTELVHATEAAHAASQAKSQFLANMSHEIRTPMNAILGMLALLRKTALTPRQADYAGKTEGAARSLLGLLNDILDFSKIEADKMTLDPQPFVLDTLLQDLSVILSTGVGKKPVELLFDIDPQVPPRLLGDAMRLQQVLINLGGNAVKFTGQGEVVLSVRRCAPANGTPHNHVTLEIAVRDSGIGIAPENQARIFNGFTQAEASTTRRFGGTGLGVVISQRLVALMGGTLQLDSELGRGSRFHFRLTLPVAAESACNALMPAPRQPAHAGAVAKPLHALVVDDNPLAREVLQRMAESLGWQVQGAEGGEQALLLMQDAKAAGRPFDAVFVDWQMPGLDGWQTSRRIRELQPAPTLVVMVTAHGRDMLAQRDEAEQSLLDGFLVKPVTATMLQQALAEARGEVAADGATSTRRSAAQDRSDNANGADDTAPDAAPQRLAGLRLLLVEDNLNNQQVALELLQAEGACVQLACDGAAAVAAVAAAFGADSADGADGGDSGEPRGEPRGQGSATAFDLVLMDLQMPVMDGYTATSRIRQTLGLDLRRLPIVAMTANAMTSDREACLAAGMNDHVGKPFDIEALVALLQRLTARRDPRPPSAPRNGAAATGTPAAAATAIEDRRSDPAAFLPPPVQQAAAIAGVEIGSALERLGRKPALYGRLLDGFVAELDGVAAQTRADVDAGRLGAAARLAHTVRGTAATLGARALAAAAGDCEAALLAAARLIDSTPQRPHENTAVAATLERWCAALEQARAPLSALRDALRPIDGRPATSADDVRDGSAGAGAAAVDAATTLFPPPADDSAERSDLQTRLQALAVLLQQSDMAALAAHDALQQRHGHSARGQMLAPLNGAVAALDFDAALQHCRQIGRQLGLAVEADPVPT